MVSLWLWYSYIIDYHATCINNIPGNFSYVYKWMSGGDVCVQGETRIQTVFIPDHLNNIKHGEEKMEGIL